MTSVIPPVAAMSLCKKSRIIESPDIPRTILYYSAREVSIYEMLCSSSDPQSPRIFHKHSHTGAHLHSTEAALRAFRTLYTKPSPETTETQNNYLSGSYRCTGFSIDQTRHLPSNHENYLTSALLLDTTSVVQLDIEKTSGILAGGSLETTKVAVEDHLPGISPSDPDQNTRTSGGRSRSLTASRSSGDGPQKRQCARETPRISYQRTQRRRDHLANLIPLLWSIAYGWVISVIYSNYDRSYDSMQKLNHHNMFHSPLSRTTVSKGLKEYLLALYRRLGFHKCGSQQDQTSGSMPQVGSTRSSSSRTGKNKSRCTQKSEGSEKSKDDDEESEQPSDQPPKKIKTGGQVLWACPYFRKDPWRHAQCLQARITKISYLKQHLYRHHDRTQCPSCNQTVKLNGRPGRQPPSRTHKGHDAYHMEGMSEAQKESITNTTARNISEVKKWVLIWEILFPSTDIPKWPEPHYIQNVFVEGMMSMRLRCQGRGSEAVRDQLVKEGIPESYIRNLSDDCTERILQRIQDEALSRPMPPPSDVDRIGKSLQLMPSASSLPLRGMDYAQTEDVPTQPSASDSERDAQFSRLEEVDSGNGFITPQDSTDYPFRDSPSLSFSSLDAFDFNNPSFDGNFSAGGFPSWDEFS
ncbi:hypothetical protein F5Y13DRAFT_198706 [Hypoxylon sp. FL1857]|nr:hypothetical protein F5Y13DRAFT_198706 [Hypoxylon sp. FL1857]